MVLLRERRKRASIGMFVATAIFVLGSYVPVTFGYREWKFSTDPGATRADSSENVILKSGFLTGKQFQN